MTRALNNPLRWLAGTGALALLVLAFAAGQARAATYPPGGGSFSGSAEGWSASSKCNFELLVCSSSAKYDGVVGNPPGSLLSETNILLSLAKLFHSEFTIESPQFTVGSDGGGSGTVSLQRTFVPKALIKLAPELKYTVNLLDKTTGTSQVALEEATQTESTAFVPKAGTVALVAGHTYAIQVSGEVTSTVVELLTLGGATSVDFDNILLTGPGTNGGNGGGGNGQNGGGGNGGGAGHNGANGNTGGHGGANGANGANTKLSNSRLVSLFRKGATSAPVQLRGNRLLVKVNCPARIGRACHITAQGMLNRRKAATTRRVVKVGKGKGKRIVLRVKRKARKQVAKRKRLLVREKVRAGRAHATVYKSRKLMRRHPRR